jgi:hypothetical protein
MWQRHARTREIQASDLSWTAEHDGYASLSPSAWHRRSVRLDPEAACLEITDVVTGGGSHDVRLAFHLGPDVYAELDDGSALLAWPSAHAHGSARIELPQALRWSLHRGETAPIVGWYSPGLGRRVPAITLLGEGRCAAGALLITRLNFAASGARAG